MLHEASSVAKAVEKAWTDAGKPTEFTIKVLEAGEKNFFGLSKSPAIVSITYEARKQAAGRSQDRPQKTILGAKHQATQPAKRESAKPVAQNIVQNKKELVAKEKNVEQNEFLVWGEEMVSFVAQELKGLLALWGANQNFSTKIDKKVLTVTLAGRLHEDAMEERNVFMSFSYLLVQLLKRHYKKKFRGFQLIITAPKNN